MKKIQHINCSGVTEWFNSLLDRGFLKKSNNDSTVHLGLPLEIRITQKVIESLMGRYKPAYEIGGVFLAEPVIIDSQNMLRINGIRYVKNISDNPGSYRANKTMKKYFNDCVRGTSKGIRYLPITFHTHPRQNSEMDEILATFFQMGTSVADKKMALRMYKFSMGDVTYQVSLPRMLCIETQSHEMFLGVYGGKVAPDDFNEYASKLLGTTMEEVMRWGFESKSLFKGIVGIISGVGLGLISTGLYADNSGFRALGMQIALIRKKTGNDNYYFSLTGNQETSIILPKHEM